MTPEEMIQQWLEAQNIPTGMPPGVGNLSSRRPPGRVGDMVDPNWPMGGPQPPPADQPSGNLGNLFVQGSDRGGDLNYDPRVDTGEMTADDLTEDEMERVYGGGGDVDLTPPQERQVRQPGNQINRVPSGGDGSWQGWLADPSNRAFMLNMGLQLMTGGWGGIGSQLAAGIAAGVRGAGATERGETLDNKGNVRQDRQDRGRGRNVRRRRGRDEEGRTALDRARQDAQLEEVETFLTSNPTPEQWAAANQPNGLLHVVFNGPQDQNRREELLHLVQSERRRSRERGQSDQLTPAELLELGLSPAPEDQLLFDRLTRAPASRGGLGNPGVGYRWAVDPNSRRITRVPMEGEGGPRGPRGNQGQGGRFGNVHAAGVDSARLTIGRVREFIQEQTGGAEVPGWFERLWSHSTNSGPWRLQLNSMRDAVAGYMHARSGAQTSVREFEHYVSTYVPQAGEGRDSILEKLANLELNTMLIGRRAGERVDLNRMLALYNEIRRIGTPYTMRIAGQQRPDVTMEEFRTILPGLEDGVVRGLPGQGGVLRDRQSPPLPPPERQPPPTRQPPPDQAQPPPAGPQSIQGLQGGGTEQDPYTVQTPDQARQIPQGRYFRGPDGVIRRRN